MKENTKIFQYGDRLRVLLPIILVIFFTGCITHSFAITDVTLCTAVDNGEPSSVNTVFAPADTVYCWIEYEYALENTPIKAVWYYEGEKMYEKEAVLQEGSGKIWFSMYATGQDLPVGSYTVKIYVDGTIKEKKFSISQ